MLWFPPMLFLFYHFSGFCNLLILLNYVATVYSILNKVWYSDCQCTLLLLEKSNNLKIFHWIFFLWAKCSNSYNLMDWENREMHVLYIFIAKANWFVYKLNKNRICYVHVTCKAVVDNSKIWGHTYSTIDIKSQCLPIGFVSWTWLIKYAIITFFLYCVSSIMVFTWI